MTQKPNISIIVPVYKVEKLVSRCIESILSQTYQDWELILVDDGSPDNSGTICDKYAANDARIRVYHKSNGGVSSARNLGLTKANGEWVTFLDADDWTLDGYLFDIEPSEDLIVFGALRSNTKQQFCNLEDKIVQQSDMSSYLKAHITDACFGVPWSKLFKHSIIEDNAIEFDQGMKIAEDADFVVRYLCYCHNIRLIAKYTYMYYVIDNDNKSRYNLSAEAFKVARDTYIRDFTNLEIAHGFKNAIQPVLISTMLEAFYYRFLVTQPFDIKYIKEMKDALNMSISVFSDGPRINLLAHKLVQQHLYTLCYLILKAYSLISK